MTARNDITGDAIATKATSDSYRSGWDRIFGKKEEPAVVAQPVVVPVDERQERRDELRAKWYDFITANQRTLDRVPEFREFVAEHHPTEFDFIFNDDRTR